METCPLCSSASDNLFHSYTNKYGYREFYRCAVCDLIFVPKRFFLSREKEKNRYDLHTNNPDDEGYVTFLGRFLECFVPFTSIGTMGLDYGSGPSPVLVGLFPKDQYEIDIYDPFYAQDRSVLEKNYDFIACTETVEHFHEPMIEFQKMHALLKPGGILGVMTGVLEDGADFKNWHYQQETTHVVFYNSITIQWIAKKLAMNLLYCHNGIFVLQK